MPWGDIELEPEVTDWYVELAEEAQARVEFHIDRLAELGPLLDEPHTKQLDGKLRELRFYLDNRPIRITYWIASGRRISSPCSARPVARRDVRSSGPDERWSGA